MMNAFYRLRFAKPSTFSFESGLHFSQLEIMLDDLANAPKEVREVAVLEVRKMLELKSSWDVNESKKEYEMLYEDLKEWMAQFYLE
ncbi:hypothetical protein NTE10_003032 [Vibrio harveyi]|uniref:hypothetical protein n=1 Tax=Vibrio harveyi TaxID=669 RepID=UPI002A420DF9|nr:hypothetical protein [Vibrio harveyi]HDM8138465.1 hypothetical protein [Vibrio harveyi]